MHRLSHDCVVGGRRRNTNTWIGAQNTFVLLTSSLFAVLAHEAAERGDGKLAARRLWYTIGGGAMFLCIKAYEWTVEIGHGMTISSSTFWSFYYTAAGIHASHVIAGVIAMAVVAMDAAKGNLELHRVETDRDLLALRRRRLDLPLPASLHREVGDRMSDHAHAAHGDHGEPRRTRSALREDLGDPARAAGRQLRRPVPRHSRRHAGHRLRHRDREGLPRGEELHAHQRRSRASSSTCSAPRSCSCCSSSPAPRPT